MTFAGRSELIAARGEMRRGLPLLPLLTMLVLPPTIWRCVAVAAVALIPALGQPDAYSFVMPGGIRWKLILRTLSVQVPVLCAVAALCAYTYVKLGIPLQRQEVVVQLESLKGVARFSMLVMVIFGAPICEELVFRHSLFGALAGCMHWAAAAVISAVVFAVVHFSWQQAPTLVVMALFFQYAYLKSGSLTNAMLLHTANNLVALLPLEAGG